MDWLAFFAGGWDAPTLAVADGHANGDPVGFSQYHSGFFKADLPQVAAVREISSSSGP
jgi:hypothetical protein